MGGFNKDGAQAVYINGANSGIFDGNSGTINTNSLFSPVGAHVENASISSAVTLTPPTDTNAIMIGFEDQSVRLRFDGADATTGTGFLFSSGDIVTIQFKAGTTFSVIETTATATIQYQWGKI